MNSINLPSAALPQSTGAASAQSALPLDLAMLDSAVPEELFAALLAGQLQALTGVTGEIAEDAAQGLSETGLSQAVAPDVSALMQVPQDVAALVSASLQPTSTLVPAAELPVQDATSLALLAGAANSIAGDALPSDELPQATDNDPAETADPSFFARQALAASAAAFATPAAAVAAPANAPAQARPEGLVLPAVSAQIASANITPALNVPTTPVQPEGPVAFALPQMQQAAPVNAVAASPVPQTTIPQQVGSQAWGGMVGERVVWMFGQQHQSAEIMLNPPSLGPLEVRLSMSDGQANLTFTTQHAPVREALEAATPRLREMLTESGIGLGTVSVNVGNFTRQDPQPQQQAGEQRPSTWVDEAAMHDFTVLATDLPSRRGNGLLDLFA